MYLIIVLIYIFMTARYVCEFIHRFIGHFYLLTGEFAI